MSQLLNALSNKDKNIDTILDLVTKSDLTFINEKRENALLLSLHYELPQVVHKILSYKNCGIDQIDHLGNNALILSLKKNYRDVAKILIKKGLKYCD